MGERAATPPNAEAVLHHASDWRAALRIIETSGVLSQLADASADAGAGKPEARIETGFAVAILMLADEALRGRARVAAAADLAAACRPRLSEAALKRLAETAEAEREVGSGQLAADIELLLEWHKAASTAVAKIDAASKAAAR